ncbi:hypothetical protein Rcae01_03618 [Novipirellula caenicola]|uniref:Uncharacterized protein n=1 Tax=Novipirellula caenicola TaxID=1536901 RepID=A0ABP9VSL4_9BACT
MFFNIHGVTVAAISSRPFGTHTDHANRNAIVAIAVSSWTTQGQSPVHMLSPGEQPEEPSAPLLLCRRFAYDQRYAHCDATMLAGDALGVGTECWSVGPGLPFDDTGKNSPVSPPSQTISVRRMSSSCNPKGSNTPL